jgi:hypothetical protein
VKGRKRFFLEKEAKTFFMLGFGAATGRGGFDVRGEYPNLRH